MNTSTKLILDTKDPKQTDWKIKALFLYFYLAGILVGYLLAGIIHL